MGPGPRAGGTSASGTTAPRTAGCRWPPSASRWCSGPRRSWRSGTSAATSRPARCRSAGCWSASVASAVVLRRAGWPRPTGASGPLLVAIGVLWFGVYNVALNAGERHVDAGTAAMLIQVSPVLVALLAAIFLGERFTACLGVGLRARLRRRRADRHVSTGAERRPRPARRAALPARGGRLLDQPGPAEAAGRRLPAIHVTWLACTVGAVVCLPFAGDLVRRRRGRASASDIWWVVYLGVFPTAIAFTTYAFALRAHDAPAASA